MKSYLWYKDFVDKKTDPEALSKIRKQGLIHMHHIELAKKELSGKQLEYYYAAYLYMEAIKKTMKKN